MRGGSFFVGVMFEYFLSVGSANLSFGGFMAKACQTEDGVMILILEKTMQSQILLSKNAI